MSRELTRQIAIISLTVIFLIGSWAYYQYRSILGRLEGIPPTEKIASPLSDIEVSDSLKADSLAMDSLMVDSAEVDSSEMADTSDPYTPINWFEENFRPEQFASPSSKYRPWVRWYWPSHHVDRLELIREIDQFYHRGIGGVEIHPTTAGLDPKTLSSSSGLHDDFSPLYFHNVKLAITELRKRGMEVDLFLGDGGTHISVEENLKSLAFSEVHVLGGKKVEMEIPGPKIPASYLLSAWAENQYDNQLGEWLDFYPDQAELITLIASKTLDENRTFIDLDLNDYIQLDFDSLYLINEFLVEDRKLVWDAPPGFWKLIAIYQMPTGMKPILSSVSDAGLTRNFLDSAANRHHYEYTLKEKGELTEFFGNGLRGIFQQRKDLMAENLFSAETLPQFSDKYSYDLLPFLPALLYPGQNNSLMEALEIKRHPEYVITEADGRIRRDYETINSHLLNQRFYSYSASWFSDHGLIHRTQPFGFDFDIIRAAGNTPIPETSQFYGGGSELFLKMVVSGANLYQRNLVSAQALSHPFQAGTMAPWKIKLAVDKLFTAGVNHLVLDGTPYQKVKGDYIETGWNPFLSPYFPYPFSSSISEKSPFWEHFPEMNAYMSRCQYMLRQGNPETEILIYYPFMGFPASFSSAKSHQEFYFNGQSIYPDSLNYPDLYQKPEISLPGEADPRVAWLESVWPIIQAIEDKGLSWNWVNDESLQEAHVEGGKIAIRNNLYQAVLLPNVPVIELATARNLSIMNSIGGRIYIYGKAPSRQKSFENYKQRDLLVNKYMLDITVPGFLNSPEDLINLFRGEPFEQTIAYKSNYSFLRQSRRSLPDGSQIAFLRNNEDKDRFFEMSLAPEIKYCYWFHPSSGEIYQANLDNRNRLRGFLFGYGSKILFCSAGSPLPDSLLTPLPRIERGILPEKQVNNRTLKHWDFIVSGKDVAGGKIFMEDTSLMDWRQVSGLTFSSSEGLYTHHFELADTVSGKRYILDLGSVYEVADVKINTELVKSLIHHPYRVDITDYLIPGPNTIEIWITPSLRNRFIGYARKGEENYELFEEGNTHLLPTGLLGPVRIWEVNK